LLPAACFGAATVTWLFLYSRFLRNYYLCRSCENEVKTG
jgi:hypothetical protein